MDQSQLRLLDEVRGLVAARALIDNALEQRIAECVAAELDRSMLAHVLGVDRSTLYRRYVWSGSTKALVSPSEEELGRGA